MLHHYLHCDIALRDLNTSRMAVPVFQSLEEYFKMINLKDIKVIPPGDIQNRNNVAVHS